MGKIEEICDKVQSSGGEIIQEKPFKRWMVCIPTKEANDVLFDLHEG